MPLAPRCLLGPRHVHPGVNTEAEYRLKQKEHLAQGRVMYPNLDWPEPWRYVGPPPVVHVAGGMWQIRCASPGCGNCPSVSPEWRLALCFDCGAIYENLQLPSDAIEIGRVLVNRPQPRWRNWNWPMRDGSETVEVLRAQNREHGDPD